MGRRPSSENEAAAAWRDPVARPDGATWVPYGSVPTRKIGSVATSGYARRNQRIPPRAGALADEPRSSADSASDRQSHLATPLRKGHCGDAGKLRANGRFAYAPGIARLARRGFHGARLEHEAAAQADPYIHCLPAILTAAGGRREVRSQGDRSGEPSALAHEPAAAGSRGRSRLGHGSQREARSHFWRASVSRRADTGW